MRVCSPRASDLGRPETDRRPSEPIGVSGRGLEVFRLHCAGRVDEGDDGQDDVLGERTPGRTKTFEPGVVVVMLTESNESTS